MLATLINNCITIMTITLLLGKYLILNLSLFINIMINIKYEIALS